MMFDRFFPDEYVASTYVIPFEKLYEDGYGALFLILTIRSCRTGRLQMNVRRNCSGGLRISDFVPV